MAHRAGDAVSTSSQDFPNHNMLWATRHNPGYESYYRLIPLYVVFSTGNQSRFAWIRRLLQQFEAKKPFSGGYLKFCSRGKYAWDSGAQVTRVYGGLLFLGWRNRTPYLQTSSGKWLFRFYPLQDLEALGKSRIFALTFSSNMHKARWSRSDGKARCPMSIPQHNKEAGPALPGPLLSLMHALTRRAAPSCGSRKRSCSHRELPGGQCRGHIRRSARSAHSR